MSFEHQSKIHCCESKQKSKMKAIFIIFAFAIFVPGQGQQLETYRLNMDNKYKFTCVTNSHVNAGNLKQIEANQVAVEKMTPQEKCYVSCMLKNNDLVDEKGLFDLKKITKQMPDDLEKDVKVIYKICEKEYPKHDCDATVRILTCLNKATQKKHKARIMLVYKGM